MTDPAWAPAGCPPHPDPGEIHVWRIDLADPHLAGLGRQVLSTGEQARAKRLIIDDKRTQFIASRAALRILLGQYLATAPEAIQFHPGPRGKPYLDPAGKHHPLQFNFTNSHTLGLLAVTVGREVGIDIEYRHRDIDVIPLARYIFSTGEANAFGQVARQDRKQVLLSAWTYKEAFIKALGEGLSLPLKSFTVPIAPASNSTLMPMQVDGAAQTWRFVALDPHPDYVATVTASAATWTLRCLDWQPPIP